MPAIGNHKDTGGKTMNILPAGDVKELTRIAHKLRERGFLDKYTNKHVIVNVGDVAVKFTLNGISGDQILNAYYDEFPLEADEEGNRQ
jgi:hypothetical protein